MSRAPLALAAGVLVLAAGPPVARAEVDPGLRPGAWALRLETATTAIVPVLGATRGGSISVSAVTVDAGPDGSLRFTHRPCTVEMVGAGGRARMSVSPSFVAAIPAKTTAARLTAEGWRIDLGLDVVGYDPAVAAAPPRAPDHPAIRDFDADGHPGATVRLDVPVLGAVELYVAQAAHVVLERGRPAAGGLRGQVRTLRFEQSTLGASHKLFAANPEIRPDPARSSFLLAPAAGPGCPAALAALAAPR